MDRDNIQVLSIQNSPDSSGMVVRGAARSKAHHNSG